MDNLRGYYCRYGYRIETVEGESVYRAGNHPQESSPDAVLVKGGVATNKLGRWCRETGEALAVELGVVFLGVEKEDKETMEDYQRLYEVVEFESFGY